jgi:hypothetical protein
LYAPAILEIASTPDAHYLTVSIRINLSPVPDITLS